MSKQSFAWKAVDLEGRIQHGVWKGDKLSEIQSRLRDEEYFPVRIRSRKDWLGVVAPKRVKVQWNSFARRLATLLEAGIPLLQALEIMTFHEEKLTSEQEQWKSIKEQVEAGSDLSQALTSLNSSPNSFVLSMIEAGEYTGTLGQCLREVADELDQESIYRKKIRASLAYPSFLLLAVVLVLYVLSVWVLPMYEKLFADMSVELPFLTNVIFEAGRKLPFVLWSGLGLSVGGLVVMKFTNPDQWKKRIEILFGRLPLVGSVVQLRDLVQFNRILGRLLEAGIPLLEALRLTAGSLHSPRMHELITQLVQNVRQGKRMSPLLRASQIFPKEGAEMIAVAEESGQLDQMFHHVTKMFRRELDEQLERLTQMIEPAMILVLAALIGLVAGGILLPIFDLSSHLE